MESRLEVTREWRGRENEELLFVYRVSVENDEKVLEIL